MLEMENDIINRKESENSENLSSTTCTSTNATVSVPKTVPPTTLTDVSKPKAQTVKKNDTEQVKPKGRQQKRKCSNATEKHKLKKNRKFLRLILILLFVLVRQMKLKIIH